MTTEPQAAQGPQGPETPIQAPIMESGAEQPQGYQTLLDREGVPALSSPPTSRLEGNSVKYSIITMSPNTPAMKAAMAALEELGCTVEYDHESLESFSIIRITAPRHLVRVEEWDALVLQEDTRRGVAENSSSTVRPEGEEFLPVEGSC